MSSQFPPGLIQSVLNSDTPWFSWPLSHFQLSHYDKLSCIEAILDHFDCRRFFGGACDPNISLATPIVLQLRKHKSSVSVQPFWARFRP